MSLVGHSNQYHILIELIQMNSSTDIYYRYEYRYEGGLNSVGLMRFTLIPVVEGTINEMGRYKHITSSRSVCVCVYVCVYVCACVHACVLACVHVCDSMSFV